MNIFQSNTYEKDLSCLHFDDDLEDSREAASEGPAVMHIRFCGLSNFPK